MLYFNFPMKDKYVYFRKLALIESRTSARTNYCGIAKIYLALRNSNFLRIANIFVSIPYVRFNRFISHKIAFI